MYVGTERVTPSFLCARLSLSESPVSGPVSLPDSGSDLVSEHMMTHDHMGGLSTILQTWRCPHLTLTQLTGAPGAASVAGHCPG